MKIALDVTISLEQNAAAYFEKAKQAKRKLEGAGKALQRSRSELQQLQQRQEREQSSAEEKKAKAAKEWYEKFRWFISSEGILCIGGRDATSNEIVIKKHTSNGDLVFHTDMAGAPFFVVKANSRNIGEVTREEAAVAAASYSKAWKLGVSMADVFSATPEQLSKTAKSGEYLTKGAFVVSGKVAYFRPSLELAVGMTADGRIMGGPEQAVRKHCDKAVVIMQGGVKASDAAKAIRKKIGGDVDDIIRALPPGGMKLR